MSGSLRKLLDPITFSASWNSGNRRGYKRPPEVDRGEVGSKWQKSMVRKQGQRRQLVQEERRVSRSREGNTTDAEEMEQSEKRSQVSQEKPYC